MLLAAKKARRLLGEDGWGQVGRFLLGKRPVGGPCLDRTDRVDLYYTAFGLMVAEAMGFLKAESPATRMHLLGYLDSFDDGKGLDLVHLAALSRSWAFGAEEPEALIVKGIVDRVEAFRCADGGFHHVQAGPCGSAYGNFLAVGAYEDVLPCDAPAEGCHGGRRLPPCVSAGQSTAANDGCRATLVLASLLALQRPDGSFANERDGSASTMSTAAAATVLTHLGRAVPAATSQWLLARHEAGGGFAAFAELPVVDLLSTATALHALGRMGANLSGIAQSCKRFVLELQKPNGGFAGSEGDPTPDVEYTFYALLAMGHLAEAASP